MSPEGALLIAATLLLVVATLRLAQEAQTARLSAVVVLEPKLWQHNEFVLATDMVNVGAASARELILTFQWYGRGAEPVGEPRRIELPALIPGQRVPYHPDTILPLIDGKRLNSIEVEAELGLEVRGDWSWIDGRRNWRLSPRRHTGNLTVKLPEFRASVHGGPQILQSDEVDRLLDGARDLLGQFETLQRMRDRNTVVPGRAGQFGRRSRPPNREDE